MTGAPPASLAPDSRAYSNGPSLVVGSTQAMLASVAARGGSFLVLVIASRAMTASQFGAFGLWFSVASALASLATLGPGEQLAYAIARGGQLGFKRQVGLLLGPAAVAVPLMAALPLFDPPLGTGMAGTALWLAIVGQLIAMHMLRGLGRVGEASFLALGLPSVLRVGSLALVGPGDASAALASLALVTVLAVVGLAARIALLHPETGNERNPVPTLAVKGLSIGVLWVLLQQNDVIWLGLLRGPQAVAEYLPTMRLAEASTIVAASINFAAVGQFAGERRPSHWLWRDLRIANGVGTLALGALSIIALRGLIEDVLGRSLLPLGPSCFLLAGYLLLTVGQPSIGRAYASGDQAPFFTTALVTVTAAVTVMGMAVAVAGTLGAAAINGLQYGLLGLWLLRAKPERTT